MLLAMKFRLCLPDTLRSDTPLLSLLQVLRDNVKSGSEETAQKSLSKEVIDLTSSEDKDGTESNSETDETFADRAAILSCLV